MDRCLSAISSPPGTGPGGRQRHPTRLHSRGLPLRLDLLSHWQGRGLLFEKTPPWGAPSAGARGVRCGTKPLQLLTCHYGS